MIEVIPALARDLQVIYSLALEIWPAAYKGILSDDQIRYMMDSMYKKEVLDELHQKEGYQFLIALNDRKPVGFALYHPKQGSPGTHRLSKLYIHKTQQRLGVGRNIINYIIEDLKRLGSSSLELNVNRDNTAIKFYEKLGFTVLREEDIDIGQGYYMNDFVMRYSF